MRWVAPTEKDTANQTDETGRLACMNLAVRGLQ